VITDRRSGVVMLVPGFPRTEKETDCLPPLQALVKAVARRNPALAVHVVSFHYPFERSDYPWNGAIVHALGGRNRAFPFRLSTWIQAATQVLQLSTSNHLIAIHSHWLAECTYVGSWISRLTRTRHIATIRGQDALISNPYLRHLRLQGMTITAGSEKAARAFQRSTGRPVDDVIPTGLDSDVLVAGRASCRSIDILGVGSLTPIKDFALFVHVIAELLNFHPKLKCMIIGDGPERRALEKQIDDYKLKDVVRLAGHVSREKVLDTMRESRIFLHTSQYEGQGYVLLEALACGLPVVCLDVGYAGSDPNVYRCRSASEMAAVLKELLSSPLPMKAGHVDRIDDTAAAFERLYGIRSS
jgi:glycosyltransferase involved in cell wall biosynthesis